MKKVFANLFIVLVLGLLGFCAWTWIVNTPPTTEEKKESQESLNNYLNEGREPGDTYKDGR